MNAETVTEKPAYVSGIGWARAVARVPGQYDGIDAPITVRIDQVSVKDIVQE